MEGLTMDAATIEKLRIMADCQDGPLDKTDARHQVERYKLAKLVLVQGCQKDGTEPICNPCARHELTPLMCDRADV